MTFLKAGSFLKKSPICHHIPGACSTSWFDQVCTRNGIFTISAKFQKKRTFPVSMAPLISCSEHQLHHSMAWYHVYILKPRYIHTSLSNKFYVKMGLISTGFVGLNWIRKLRSGGNHIKVQVLIPHSGFSSSGRVCFLLVWGRALPAGDSTLTPVGAVHQDMLYFSWGRAGPGPTRILYGCNDWPGLLGWLP